ncbi:MAG: O-antigen ligase family protein [Limisphaerales bacterium]
MMAAVDQKTIAQTAQSQRGPEVFGVVAGLFFFVAILKFGDPVILDNVLTPPENAQAAIYESWPVQWGYWLMLPLIVAGLASVLWRMRGSASLPGVGLPGTGFRWPLALPLVWLGWQLIASAHSVSPKLSAVTLEHFSACVILFYLGYFGLKGVRNPWPLWTGLALAFCWVLRAGFEQHFGGLEATRRLLFSMKDFKDLPPGLLNNPAYLKRLGSTRIFSTFSNPDALAGCIVLLLPVALAFLWQITPKVRTAMRRAFVVVLGGCGLACLYWSGSKGGGLVALVLAMAVLGHSALSTKWKRILICSVIIIEMAGFGIRYATSFEKQKISVTTRAVYWRAALQIAARHPLLGTGPGTFSVPYAQIKRPSDDFTRLCHNDYLEQACDSGIPGFLAYASMIIGCLSWLYRYRSKSIRGLNYAVWLGLVGLCLQSVVEYHLYIPALAWPMFFLMGFAMNNEN